jgi:spermidine synthase
VVLWALALSGFAALAYEVLWTRALLFFLGNSVYAFSTVVVTFLLGLAVGGWLFARVAGGAGRDPLVWLGVVEILIGLSAAASVPLLAGGLHRAAGIWPALAAGWDWHAPLAARFLPAFLALFPAAVFMGGTLPLAAQLYAADRGRLGSRLGGLYAANTLGAIVGSVTAGFALIPRVGVLKGVAALAVLNALIGVGLLLAAGGPAARRVVVAGVIAVLASAGLATTSAGLRLWRGDEAPDRLLFYREGVTATVKVAEAGAGQRFLSIDGFPVAGTLKVWRPIQKLLGHLPMLLHPDPRRVLIIGLGAGGTAWAMRQYDPDVLDCVELSPEVVEAARFFPEVNHGILGDPRLRLVLDDGRNHLRVSEAAYDVISVDATAPKAAGNGSLYTREFYQLTRRRLAEGGLLVQWLPYHLLSAEELRVILNTLSAVYPDLTLWYSGDARYLIALGATRPLVIDVVHLRGRLHRERVQRDLADVGLVDPFAVLRLFAMDGEGVRRFVGDGVPLNTDRYPVIEFYRRAPADFGLFPFTRREGVPGLRRLVARPGQEADAAGTLKQHLRVFDHVILGRYYEERDRGRSLKEFARAIALDGGVKSLLE